MSQRGSSFISERDGEWDFNASDWLKALRLNERLPSPHGLAVGDGPAEYYQIDLERARRRLQRWRSQPPFMSGPYFAQRLDVDLLSEEQFLYLLGETSESLDKRSGTRPPWLVELERAFTRYAGTVPDTELCQSLETLFESGDLGFLVLIKPLIYQSLERLHESVELLQHRYSSLPFNPQTVEQLLFSNLTGPLSAKLSSTMVLELNVARLRGELEGDTTAERFKSFLRRLPEPQVASRILREYPVLARQLITALDQWVRFGSEFLNRLCEDWDSLQTLFSPDEKAGQLTKVLSGTGDTHREGRSVLVACFSSGLKLVYKPHSLSVDVHFTELLDWINAKSIALSFRTLKILARGAYGWVEFIEARGCDSTAEVMNFYERQGGYLALLYALEATDFHFENLIAAGEHPVLIDLEALFHPRLEIREEGQASLLAAADILNHSVLRVGLLPQRIWTRDGSDGLEVSGLGGAPGQLTPYAAPAWANAGTDEMRLIRKHVETQGSKNRPSLAQGEVNVQDYTDSIVAGFTHIYQLLLEHQRELLADDGLLAAFAADEVRAILRPTHTYWSLLGDSFHPDVLRDGLDRDRLLDRLWMQVRQHPFLARIIPFEQADLHGGNIPLFTARPDSRDLWSSDGERIPEFFSATGFELVRRRLQGLSQDDLALQVWFIRASLATLTKGKGRGTWNRSQVEEEPSSSGRVNPEQLLSAARAVGERILALSLREKEHVSWLGVTLIRERLWSITPLGTDLYDGTPGVILFLAYLSASTGDERFKKLAQRALKDARHLRKIDEERFGPQKLIGAFSGLGGWLYLLTHLGRLWAVERLLDEAELIVASLPQLIAEDEHLDIIGGSAGCLGALLSLYRCRASERTLAAVLQCGDRLLARARLMQEGIAWETKVGCVQPLTGFSHGAAGMAWALLELSGVTGEERFRRAAAEAMVYERSVFSAERDNWPDFRADEATGETSENYLEKYAVTWCHGAVGIGLARLHALPHMQDDALRAEVHAALKTTMAEGFGYNHSLCHGDLGNIELLLQASRAFDDPSYAMKLERIATGILASIEERGWLCGVPHGVETPGLMTGLSGIGYGLLRLAAPTQVPSLLLLEPPRPLVASTHVSNPSTRT